MKVNDFIRLLKGAKRYALYNLKMMYVEHISDLQANILLAIASGKRVKSSDFKVTSIEFWQAIGALRKLDVFSAGHPSRTDIEFRFIENEHSISRFEQVWLEITNSCNLSCSHCYSESSPRVDRSDELNSEEWKHIIDKLATYGVRLITIIGGEPLLRYKLIEDLICYIKDKYPDTKINIFTNLTMLPPSQDFLFFLRDNHIRVGTSLYGVEASKHDKMTNKNGSWNKTTSSIKKLTDNNVEVFAGYYKSSSCSEDDKEISDFIESLGVLDYEIMLPSKVGRGSGTEWRLLNLDNNIPKRKYFHFASPYKNNSVHNCFSDRISINQAGEVLPCIMTRNVSYGNIYNSDLEEILSSDYFKKYSLLSKNKIDGCKECEFRYGCFDCRPDAQSGGDNLYRKPDCGYTPNGEI